MLDIFVNSKSVVESDNCLYYNDELIGFINPSSIYIRAKDEILVSGPHGQLVIDSGSEISSLGSLVACGALLVADAASIDLCQSLLRDPRHSRTYSYLLAATADIAAANAAISRLQSSCVVIVGCGGIGSLAAVLLAGSGVRKLVLVDGDVVEESNLNRQIFWRRADIGRPKVEVLSEAIHERYEAYLNVETVQSFVEEGTCSEIAGYAPNLAIITADDPIGIHEVIADKLNSYSIAVVGGGYNNAVGMHYEQSSASSNLDRPQWHSLSRAFPISPSFGPVNSEVAGLISNRAIQLISGIGECHKSRYYFSNTRDFPRLYRSDV